MAPVRKASPPERIETNQRFAAASAILRTLENGLQQIERDADALRIEDHLARKPSDPRATILRERLTKHRGSAAQKVEPTPSSAGTPATVMAALELLRGSRPVRRMDRKALLEQLAEDRDLIREAILAQASIVDGIRGELSYDLAVRLKAQHRELLLTQYRALQAVAAATDAAGEFRRSVVDGGYVWRDDLLPAPSLRSALILGSEAVWDSEIGRTRRLLEEWKLL